MRTFHEFFFPPPSPFFFPSFFFKHFYAKIYRLRGNATEGGESLCYSAIGAGQPRNREKEGANGDCLEDQQSKLDCICLRICFGGSSVARNKRHSPPHPLTATEKSDNLRNIQERAIKLENLRFLAENGWAAHFASHLLSGVLSWHQRPNAEVPGPILCLQPGERR